MPYPVTAGDVEVGMYYACSAIAKAAGRHRSATMTEAEAQKIMVPRTRNALRDPQA